MVAKKKVAKKRSLVADKRKTVRRRISDRRSEIRYEPDKENRRQNTGRRSSDVDIWGLDKNTEHPD
jgi:hypothetical protein